MTKILKRNSSSSRNRFDLTEWNGAMGDLGTLLPLAFALVAYNGFPAVRLFFLWGMVYLITGHFFKIPVSVQPLKAMTVIAITSGIPSEFLSVTAVFYGLILLLLTQTGLIRWLQGLFSPAMIRGIQLGIGLLLGRKAFELIRSPGLYFGGQTVNSSILIGLAIVGLIVFYFSFKSNKPFTIFFLLGCILVSSFWGVLPDPGKSTGGLISLTLPNLKFLQNACVLLIIPQLPLTLGNAVFAANDACHEFWPERSGKVTSDKLARSIGISNIGIGFLGGFPICHGAGGIAAHARFGAKTGGATMILGGILVLLSVFDHLGNILFLIPIPILGALLLIDSWSMIRLTGRLPKIENQIIALSVGLSAFFTNNLSIAVAVGFVIQKLITLKIIRSWAGMFAQKLSSKPSEIV